MELSYLITHISPTDGVRASKEVDEDQLDAVTISNLPVTDYIICLPISVTIH